MLTLYSLFIQGTALGISAGAAPGPMQAYLITETLSGGWRRSLPLIFVPIFSDSPILILTALILNQLPDRVLKVISILGGLFVLYIALGFWQQWRENNPEPATSEKKQRHSFLKAVALNLLNPNPYLFWSFVGGPILISAIKQSWAHALIFLGSFYAVFLITMIAIIVLFHQTQRLGPTIVRAVQLASVIILVIFGGILLREGIFG
jgi:threonine/homoserine/homoserine lactone efflux protein